MWTKKLYLTVLVILFILNDLYTAMRTLSSQKQNVYILLRFKLYDLGKERNPPCMHENSEDTGNEENIDMMV